MGNNGMQCCNPPQSMINELKANSQIVASRSAEYGSPSPWDKPNGDGELQAQDSSGDKNRVVPPDKPTMPGGLLPFKNVRAGADGQINDDQYMNDSDGL